MSKNYLFIKYINYTLIRFIWVVLIIVFNNFMYGQTIEKLNTNKKVANFLKKNINKNYTFKEVFDKEKEEDKEDFEFFVKKVDLDGNGHKDLIVDAYAPLIIILDEGDEKYKEINFQDNFESLHNSFLDTIISVNENKVLVFKLEIDKSIREEFRFTVNERIQEPKSFNSETKKIQYQYIDKTFSIDSLIVKYGQIIRFKSNKSKVKNIKEFNFSTTGCYGNCPVFDFKISKNRFVEFNGKQFTNHIGKKDFILNEKDYTELINLIEYAELDKIEDFNKLVVIDAQNINLSIHFEDGSVREINDNGIQAPINLKAVYNKVFEIVNSI